MLSPIAVEYLSGCVKFIGMSPTVLDLLLVCKLSKLSRIHGNITKLVDVIWKVGNQIHLNQVEIRFCMYQLHKLVVLFFTVFLRTCRLFDSATDWFNWFGSQRHSLRNLSAFAGIRFDTRNSKKMSFVS